MVSLLIYTFHEPHSKLRCSHVISHKVSSRRQISKPRWTSNLQNVSLVPKKTLQNKQIHGEGSQVFRKVHHQSVRSTRNLPALVVESELALHNLAITYISKAVILVVELVAYVVVGMVAVI